MGRAIVTERDLRDWHIQQQGQLQNGLELKQEKVPADQGGLSEVWEKLHQLLDRLPEKQAEPGKPPETEESQEEGEVQPNQERRPDPPPPPPPAASTFPDSSPEAIPAAPPPPPAIPPTIDTYTDKLLKLIPAESVALYLTLQGIILSGAAESTNLDTWLWFILIVGLIGTALYQWRILKIVKVAQLTVSTAAFGVWVFALGGAFATLSWYEPFIGSLVLVIFTFFAPLINPDVLSTDQA